MKRAASACIAGTFVDIDMIVYPLYMSHHQSCGDVDSHVLFGVADMCSGSRDRCTCASACDACGHGGRSRDANAPQSDGNAADDTSVDGRTSHQSVGRGESETGVHGDGEGMGGPCDPGLLCPHAKRGDQKRRYWPLIAVMETEKRFVGGDHGGSRSAAAAPQAKLARAAWKSCTQGMSHDDQRAVSTLPPPFIMQQFVRSNPALDSAWNVAPSVCDDSLSTYHAAGSLPGESSMLSAGGASPSRLSDTEPPPRPTVLRAARVHIRGARFKAYDAVVGACVVHMGAEATATVCCTVSVDELPRHVRRAWNAGRARMDTGLPK